MDKNHWIEAMSAELKNLYDNKNNGFQKKIFPEEKIQQQQNGFTL